MLTNDKNIPVALAVMLATDNYNFKPSPNRISVTSLIDSPKKWILSNQISETGVTDISMLIAARMGSSFHAAIEKAWEDPKEALYALGYTTEQVESLKVAQEVRMYRDVLGWTVSGQFDMVLNGYLQDHKEMGMYKYEKADFDSFRKQMSIYRWLDQGEHIHSSKASLNIHLKGWSALEASYKKDYPQCAMLSYPIELMTLKETEEFVTERIKLFQETSKLAPSEMPDCTGKELWQEPPVWQYFANPTNIKATKNFPTEHEATQHLLLKGKGVIKFKSSKARRCMQYCPAYSICPQAHKLKSMGLLHESN